MKKLAIAAAMALFAFGTTFVVNLPAQAYPDVQASVSASDYDLVSGQEFTVVASSSTECDWDIDWNGSSREVRGTQFQTTFVAPEVTTTTSDELNAVCRFEDPRATSAQAGASVIEPEKLVFTIRPAASSPNNGAALAGTGGPDQMVLLSGVALLFAGAGVAMVARRRAEQAEFTS